MLCTDDNTVIPEENDKIIMNSIEKAMNEDKLYKRVNLTLDVFAKEIGFNRYYVSIALNRCTHKNFNSCINEYRVKEAVRIMSEPHSANLTTDAIAFEAGFNDRQSPHLVFKKITGLSPGDFRKNMVGK
ncbi:MAG: AraC family transcriptional regulator [Prevotellaceae bacterium]|jgi:YesN/AraC family two-component response regulator|nr:AraC family transcriptional regulator [Prevotellaceae bacterium]